MHTANPKATIVALLASMAATPCSAAMILNSSELSLHASAWARTVLSGTWYDEDSADLAPADTLITDFNDSISASASVGACDDWDCSDANSNAGSSLSLNVDLAGSTATFDLISGAYVYLDSYSAESWTDAGGTGLMNYVASFTLTSAYAYDASTWFDNMWASPRADNIVSLLSQDGTIFGRTGENGDVNLDSGVLAAGDYQLITTVICEWEAPLFKQDDSWCRSDLEFNLQLNAVSEVPLPGAFPLLASGTVALLGFMRRKAH